jgi:hypothetical protein
MPKKKSAPKGKKQVKKQVKKRPKPRREDFSQAAVRIVREATEK